MADDNKGRSVWDLPYDLVMDDTGNGWRLLRFLGMFACGALSLAVPAGLLIWALHPSVHVSDTGAVSVQPFFGHPTTVILVDPFGWQSSRLSLSKGDRFSISASGRVHVGYVDYVGNQIFARVFQDSIKDGGADAPWDFIRSEWVESKPYHWAGPEGYFDREKDPADVTPHLLDPRARRGQLIAAICPSGGTLHREDVAPDAWLVETDFPTSGHVSMKSPSDGVLWLAVNDDSRWLEDNIGYFSVTIEQGE
jgi:hypothetical protein